MRFVEFKLELGQSRNDSAVIVQILVTRDEKEQPLIAFNVVDQLTKDYQFRSSIPDASNLRFPHLPASKWMPFVACLTSQHDEVLGTVKSPRRTIVIPKNQRVAIKCRVKRLITEQSTPVPFEPEVENIPEGLEINSSLLHFKRDSSHAVSHDAYNGRTTKITLREKALLGSLQTVQSVASIEITDSNVGSSNDPKEQNITQKRTSRGKIVHQRWSWEKI